MVRLQIQATATGWHVHLHPSDRFNRDQNDTFAAKREALEPATRFIEQWRMELEDGQPTPRTWPAA